MSTYELAVWEGPRPTNDAVALLNYLDLYDQYIGTANFTPPHRRIRMFTQALLTRWPVIDDSTDSPWSVHPPEKNARGPIVYLAIACGQAGEVVPFAVQLAIRSELVCFDPQEECLLPVR